MGLLPLVLLAVVQGLTEFLPVSSSGHLALVERWLRIPEEARLPVTVFIHLGTLLALLLYFRGDLASMVRGVFRGDRDGRRLLGHVLLANLATAAIALPLERKVEQAFSSPRLVSLFWMVTAGLLFASERWAARRPKDRPIVGWRALVVGVAQGLAVFPGLSRSGATISAGLFCGLGREQAGRFAFLVGIPAVAGANLVEAKDIVGLALGWGPLALATGVAFGVGLWAIHWTLRAVQSMKLRWFSVYCVFVALGALGAA
jgi:undecaprenyl-diphosphatase